MLLLQWRWRCLTRLLLLLVLLGASCTDGLIIVRERRLRLLLLQLACVLRLHGLCSRSLNGNVVVIDGRLRL